MSFELPEFDRKATRSAVDAALEKYRVYKSTVFEEKEVKTTAELSATPRSNTGITSDQTGNIATYNVDEPAARRAYCRRIEEAVRLLPKRERILITERYLNTDCDFDYIVYNNAFERPISEATYYQLKWKAFYKLALNLNIQVVNEETGLRGNKRKRKE
ncbi:ArpU family phage packaging/lysis transcriptional regulator [Paenibacillus sp. P46E]|uniref:ArpU family phage packaging/lysis transcriptional regulator n=1 Tax=Paenibacillus sp. P46E TaxID=1349436 RepID=UPI00093E59B2|nr:ArpU family phage packaging/lysis transcriptional regulator [Paenibacillus sp. P46E]OKP97733.1 transcriptional regulator [Paenibacillus sp. P46E]